MPKDASERFRCRFCLKTYSTRTNRTRHELSHEERQLACNLCGSRFARSDELQRHENTCGNRGSSGKNKKSPTDEQFGGADNATRALNGAVEDKVFYPRDAASRNDLLQLLAQSQQPVITYLKSKLRVRAIKWYVVVQVEFSKQNNDGEEITSTPYFRSNTFTGFTDDTFNVSDVHEAFQKVYGAMENYIRESSGWALKKCALFESAYCQLRTISRLVFIIHKFTNNIETKS